MLGIILGHERRWAESDAEFDATVKLDPNYADAWAMRSDLITLNGRPADGVEHVRKALRLNPHPPGWYYWMLGQAQYALRDYESAIQTASQARNLSHNIAPHPCGEPGTTRASGGGAPRGTDVHDEQSEFHHPALVRLATFPR